MKSANEVLTFCLGAEEYVDLREKLGAAEQLRPAPQLATALDTRYITGLGAAAA